MEVKDLIGEELTDEQKKLLEEDENKKKYKALQIYIQSDDFLKLCEKFEKKWDEIKENIIKMISERKETKSTKSQLDKDVLFKSEIKVFIMELKESEWEKILKDFFQKQIEALDTHIFDKISNEQELYDVPFYTDIDLQKQVRIDFMCFWKRVKAITASFAKVKEEIENPNPYES